MLHSTSVTDHASPMSSKRTEPNNPEPASAPPAAQCRRRRALQAPAFGRS